MLLRRMMPFVGILCLTGALAQDKPASAQAPSGSAPVIKTETKLVLVDTVVADKKGAYIHDLELKNFRVWEDNKEVTVKSFSFEADPNSPSNAQKHYLVLFFDNSTMEPGDQVQARKAAAKFIEGNAGPNRLIAIVNFGGSVRIAQNFTGDAERLKQVVAGVKTSAVSPNAQPATVEVASLGMPTLGNAESDFGARSVMLALRSMAKNLAPVPGRKTLIFLTSGFAMTEEVRSELTAVIDTCNKSNVAVYPIDVRGLVAGGGIGGPAAMTSPVGAPQARLLRAAFSFGAIGSLTSFGNSFLPQHAGGGGGGGAPGGGGGGGGARPGGGGAAGGGATGGGTTGGGGKGGTGGTTGGGGKGGTGGTTGGG